MRVIQGTGSVRAVWSRMNVAYLILWGDVPHVLAIKSTEWEARDYMREIGAL